LFRFQILFKFENGSDFKFCSNLKIFQKSSRKMEKKEIRDGPRPSLPPVRGVRGAPFSRRQQAAYRSPQAAAAILVN
jgi:hypothetical protein